MKKREKTKFSDMFVISSALLTCFAVTALNILIVKWWRFDLMTLNAGFIPYGSAIIGMLASSGSLLAAKITKKPLAKITFQAIPFISLFTYFLYHYVNYIIEIFKIPGNMMRMSDIISFFKYLHLSITQRIYISPTFIHNTNPARYGGYLFAALELFGVWVGSFVIIEYLKKIHKKACQINNLAKQD